MLIKLREIEYKIILCKVGKIKGRSWENSSPRICYKIPSSKNEIDGQVYFILQFRLEASLKRRKFNTIVKYLSYVFFVLIS